MRVFEYKEVLEEKVKIIIVKLKKNVVIWWGSLKKKDEHARESKIKTSKNASKTN